MASFEACEADPGGAAESAYLAVLAAAVLLPPGFLASWPTYEAGICSGLDAAMVRALPSGPGSRGIRKPSSPWLGIVPYLTRSAAMETLWFIAASGE
jgi:hypothetical protein